MKKGLVLSILAAVSLSLPAAFANDHMAKPADKATAAQKGKKATKETTTTKEEKTEETKDAHPAGH